MYSLGGAPGHGGGLEEPPGEAAGHQEGAGPHLRAARQHHQLLRYDRGARVQAAAGDLPRQTQHHLVERHRAAPGQSGAGELGKCRVMKPVYL